jgi:anti-sigma factor RsiW
MLSTDSTFPISSPCGRAEALRDYAFDEQLSQEERRAMEQHLATCGDCALELDQFRLTTAALHTLPDREIPQRIAFVSDRVFEPSPFRRFWNSGARLGFASACVLGVALVVSAWHLSGTYRPAEVHTVVQAASASEINAAVAKAVAQVRAEDAQMIQTAIQTSEQQRDQEYRGQMVALEENFDVLRKTMNRDYARLEGNELGAGQ